MASLSLKGLIMNLRYVSITGADDKTAISDLEALQQEFALLEVAILYFPERDGYARNPLKPWREALYASRVKQKAMHLCGSGINRLADGHAELIEEIQHFNRIQINLKPQYASVELVEKLVQVVQSFPKIEFITQYNDANQDYFKFWNFVANHNYLFDASLGKGLAPESWQAPVAGKSCGYAGGLSDSNIMDNMVKINAVTGDKPVWIDMESGVRTHDELDLNKVRSVLKQVAQFQNRKP
jgi:phosphoribosylanthranilate isomerase